MTDALQPAGDSPSPDGARTSALVGGSGTFKIGLPASPTPSESWVLVDDGFVLAREHEVESVFAVGNGAIGVRGSVAEGTSLSDPATFVAGVFDLEPHWNSIPGLMVLADWTDLRVIVEGRPLSLETGETLHHRRLLDMRQGLLFREWVHRDEAGRVTRLQFLRFASLAHRDLAVQCATIVPENYTGHVQFESRIGLASVRVKRWQATPGRPRPALRVCSAGDDEPAAFLQSTATGTTVAFAVATAATTADEDGLRRASRAEGDTLIERLDWNARVGEPIRIDRVVVLDRENKPDDNGERASRGARTAMGRGVDALVKDHVAAWTDRWRTADVRVDGEEDAQRALRFAIYHLIIAANRDDPHVSVGARALTGEAYRGHVFWDTEIYLLPFYTYTDPATARSLLEYRYYTLPGARRKARALGCRGALYAWESTDTGDETTPTSAVTPNGEIVRILTGEEEHHISADVAYAVWQYWRVSGDEPFLRQYGVEILLETARFWASRGAFEADGCYHIRRVIGPDEYHETIDDNAFTNVMARWNLERGAEAAALMEERWPDAWRALSSRLAIEPGEPARWREIAAEMKTGFDRRSGLFEQFDGFFGLEDLSLASFEPRNAPMDIILQRERLQKSKVIKQADVVALSALLWDDFPRHVHDANFRYYEPRTAHGSSLSPALHAMVAARLGDDLLFDRLFRQAAEIDLANNMGNAAGGVHIAALGGLWQAAVLGVGGVRPHAEGLVLDPHVPRTWRSVWFPVQWHGRLLTVTLERPSRAVNTHLEGPGSMVIRMEGGQAVTMEPGTTWRAQQRANGRWDEWEEVGSSTK